MEYSRRCADVRMCGCADVRMCGCADEVKSVKLV